MKELYMEKRLWQESLTWYAIALTAGIECVSEIPKKQVREGTTWLA